MAFQEGFNPFGGIVRSKDDNDSGGGGSDSGGSTTHMLSVACFKDGDL